MIKSRYKVQESPNSITIEELKFMIESILKGESMDNSFDDRQARVWVLLKHFQNMILLFKEPTQ